MKSGKDQIRKNQSEKPTSKSSRSSKLSIVICASMLDEAIVNNRCNRVSIESDQIKRDKRNLEFFLIHYEHLKCHSQLIKIFTCFLNTNRKTLILLFMSESNEETYSKKSYSKELMHFRSKYNTKDCSF